MAPEGRRQSIQFLVKRLRKVGDDPSAADTLLERHFPADDDAERSLHAIVSCFLNVREQFRESDSNARSRLSALLPHFIRIARKRGVSLEAFYAALAERVLFEEDPCEPGRHPAKSSAKERVLEAALQVFSEKGFHQATVEEIADRAGVGKGTLYRYFSSKETLFNELVTLRLEELEKSAFAVLDGQDDVLTMIRKVLHTYFEFFDRNQRLYRLIEQERLEVGNKVQDLYFGKVMRRIPMLRRKIYAARQEGLVKDVDFRTVFFGVMGFIHGVIQRWLASECAYPLLEELPGVMEVLFYGFVSTSPKRIEQLNYREEQWIRTQ